MHGVEVVRTTLLGQTSNSSIDHGEFVPLCRICRHHGLHVPSWGCFHQQLPPGIPQIIHLDLECTGNPKTCLWAMLTNQMVFYDGRHHVQFNSMYVATLKVASAHYMLILGTMFAGIVSFGDIKCEHSGGKGGDGIGGGRCQAPRSQLFLKQNMGEMKMLHTHQNMKLENHILDMCRNQVLINSLVSLYKIGISMKFDLMS